MSAIFDLPPITPAAIIREAEEYTRRDAEQHARRQAALRAQQLSAQRAAARAQRNPGGRS